MTIGIDAHSLEGQRTGVGRYLMNLLMQWDDLTRTDVKFVLYFKDTIPQDLNLKKDYFELKLVKANKKIKSNALYLHYYLPKAIKKDKIDNLFCPSYIAPLRYKGKFALTLHDIIYEARPKLYNWPSPADKILLKRVSRRSAHSASTILTPSEFTKNEIIKHYHIEPSKIRVTLEAADDSFKQIKDDNIIKEVKEKYQIENKFIFYVGSIFNRRRLFESICAFKKIAHEISDYQFLIAGANHTQPWLDIDRLIELTNEELGRRAIIKKEYIETADLTALYNASDLLVWLSDYEGFGLPVLEAMACGTPVVTSYKTSLMEVADEAAIFVRDTKNIDEIADMIYKGITDKKLRSSLKKKGLENVKRFSWQKCAQKTLDALLN